MLSAFLEAASSPFTATCTRLHSSLQPRFRHLGLSWPSQSNTKVASTYTYLCSGPNLHLAFVSPRLEIRTQVVIRTLMGQPPDEHDRFGYVYALELAGTYDTSFVRLSP